MHSLMRETALFYAKNLPSADEILEYLARRGIDEKTVRKFGLGASLDYDSLPKKLFSLGYTEEEMISAGVCKKNEKGKLCDFEAERLIVPIINSMGKVIAFGGRILQDKGFGKYKNTAETILFNKKNTLFNVNNLKKVKQETDFDYVIMVEGYMDAISLSMAGFENVVASMGTSLTLSQAKLLKRYASKVLVSYDGDGAGQKATLRSLDIFENEGFEVKVVSLPDGLDPDDVIKKYGKEAYADLLSKALPLIDFNLNVIENGKDLTDVSDKRKYISECLQVIKTVKSEYLREELLHKIGERSGISYQSLKRDLESGNVTLQEEKPQQKIEVKSVKADGLSVAERAVLWAYLNDKDYVKSKDVSLIYFSDKTREKIAEYLLYGDDNIKSKLYNVVGDEGVVELNAVLSAGDVIPVK